MSELSIFLLILGGTCYYEDDVITEYSRHLIYYNEIVHMNIFVNSLTQEVGMLHNWRMDSE